jgi:hypothetical protein
VTKDKVSVKILKTFEPADRSKTGAPTIRTIVVEPIGMPAARGSRIELPNPFLIEKGAVLDLSSWYGQLTKSSIKPTELVAK